MLFVWKFTQEKELLSLSVNSAGNYASVGLLSNSNKYMIHSFGLQSSEPTQRQQIDLKLPSTQDKKANDCPIQWGIHADTEELLAVGANQKLELWNFARSVPQPFSLTQGHLLAIRDINWSSDPNLLGSCSYDSSVLIWDTRNNTQPSVRIKTLAGASSIKFCREKEEIIALAHEDIVTIWDIRFGNKYLAFLDVPAKVLNFDWHPKVPQVLSTASKDGYIRMWDYEQYALEPYPLAEQPHRQNGVSRIKFTPCGRGLVTCSTIITHKSPSITLWSLRESSSGNWQIDNAGFVGSKNEQVVGMEWTHEQDGYKLCTISKSKEMTLYQVDPRSFSSMENPEGKALGKKRQTLTGAASDQFKSTEHYEPTSLQEEVELIKKYISQNDRIDFQQIGQRRYSVKMRSSDNKNIVQCVISLPPLYPRACEPNFEIYTSLGLIEVSIKSELIQTLTSTAAHYVSHNRFCLRYCIDTLCSSFHKLSMENSVYQDLNELYTQPKISPPLMRARFGANDKLCFCLVHPLVKTTRAQTDLIPRLNPRELAHSLSQPSSTSATRYTQDISPTVKVFDLSYLSRLNYGLARDTLFFNCDPSEACYKNRLLAATHNRHDLVQVWHLLLQLVNLKEDNYSLYMQFMAEELVSRILEYYLKIRDVQAAATISSFMTAYNIKMQKKAKLIIRNTNINQRVEFYKIIYSQVLSRWNLHHLECKALKCMQQDKPTEYKFTRWGGGKFKCDICNCLVNGLFSKCAQCYHGGHLHHVRNWFSTNGECPTGCGCICIQIGSSKITSS
ncbi:WD repeat-containing protein 59 [Oopsacas minuta]|uniref:WD repeat-containing protein 59 n=1 Tax=Oopsacas minuta TaxID=111878 RepID=A0AAV7K7Q5_9METZ|nr:WD repeat-containing protein 59 [Oopsacas minuta]